MSDLSENLPPEGPSIYPVAPHADPDPARVPDTAADPQPGEKWLHQAGEAVGQVGAQLLEKGKKVEDAVESLGEKVLTAGEVIAEKATHLAEKVGEEVLETGGEVLQRTKTLLQDASRRLGEEADRLMEKAREEAEAEAREQQQASEPPKSHLEALREDALSDKKSFFEKADQFAKGEHTPGKLSIVPGSGPAKRERPDAPTAGFEDRDGDGDDIIDDAEIVDSPEAPQP